MATVQDFAGLKHFQVTEFRHPELMNADFLRWLDHVREVAGIPFHLTSDARTPEENAAASGSSPTSLHLLGRAVDFQNPEDVTARYHIVSAIFACEGRAPGPIELELVHGPTDHHIHLGCYLQASHPPQLELTLT
jgi:hypothetical protein